MRAATRFVVGAWLACGAWLGCNAILGNESAVFAPENDAATSGPDAQADATTPPTDASVDVAVDVAVDANPCKDLDRNPQHCGACNHDCLGGGCDGGRCQPVRLALADDAYEVAVDTTHVYWLTGEGAVARIPKSGSDAGPETLYDGDDNSLGDTLGVVGDSVYFTVVSTDGGVVRCPKTGCGDAGPEPVVPNLDGSRFARVHDGGTLLFAELGATGRIGRCAWPCDAGAPEILAEHGDLPRFADLGGGRVFYTSLSPFPGVFASAPTDGGARSVLGDLFAPGDVAVVGSEVLVGDLQAGLRFFPFDGGSPRALVTTLPRPVTQRFVVEPPLVYFTDEASTGRVLSCPLTGCSGPTVLAGGQIKPAGIATDEAQVYWATRGNSSTANGTIMRVAK